MTGIQDKGEFIMNKRTNWIVGISDGKTHKYKIGNVTFTVFSEFEPMKSEQAISQIWPVKYLKIQWQRNMCVRLPGRRTKCSRERKLNKQGSRRFTAACLVTMEETATAIPLSTSAKCSQSTLKKTDFQTPGFMWTTVSPEHGLTVPVFSQCLTI